MAIDPTNKTFEYTLKADGSVTYKSAADDKEQNLSGMDISSREALEKALADYTEAYVSGLVVETVDVGDRLKVGQKAMADAEVVLAPVVEEVAVAEESVKPEVAQPETVEPEVVVPPVEG